VLPELKLATSSSSPPSLPSPRRDLSLRDLSFFDDSLARVRVMVGLGVGERCSNRRPRLAFRPSEPPIGVGSDMDCAMR
jgi:hypothetical protein